MDIEGRDILKVLRDLQSELSIAGEYNPSETVEDFLERSQVFDAACETLRRHQHLPPKQEPTQ